MQMFVELFDAFGAVISFRNHFHFYLCTFHGISFSDHGAEYPVTAEVGVGGDQQVSQIGGVIGAAVYRLTVIGEPFLFLRGVGPGARLKFVSLFHSAAVPRRNGIDVLQY